MAKDERFSLVLVVIAAFAFGAGVLCYGRYEDCLHYEQISFAQCQTVWQIADVYLTGYLRTVFLILPVFFAGYTPFSTAVSFSVMAERAFPYGIAAGCIYRADKTGFYICFMLFSGSVLLCYLASCRMAHEFACAASSPALLRGSFHRRQYTVRCLQVCFFLALICALWCCGSMTGVLAFQQT